MPHGLLTGHHWTYDLTALGISRILSYLILYLIIRYLPMYLPSSGQGL
jgi:hypothetical protein